MKNIHFLVKPASSLCSLRCRYCFYADEAQNREQQSMGHMSEETARTLIEEGFRWIEPGGAVSFMFQGGEPTGAGLPFFETFTALARKLCPDGVRLSFSIQTNGMLLDEAWCRFFRENRFLVGLSLDGNRAFLWMALKRITTYTAWMPKAVRRGTGWSKQLPCCKSIMWRSMRCVW